MPHQTTCTGLVHINVWEILRFAPGSWLSVYEENQLGLWVCQRRGVANCS